ncbi:SulP family inorganic anion transporter [Nocardia sp. NPDC004582]
MRNPLRGLGRPKPADAISGFVTGLFSIPEGLAYAAIGGFNPVAGIYSGIVPTILGSVFARTVLMVTTLTSAIAFTSRSVISEAGLDPHDLGNIAMLTVLAGAVMILLGVLRMGAALTFVSNAVMTGFSAGIAVQIFTGSLKDATAYSPQGHNKIYQIGDWLAHIGDWKLAATLTALAAIGVWAAVRYVPKLEPVAILVSLLVVSVAVGVLGIGVELARDIADIPSALPPFTAPDLSALRALLPGAFAVALVALAQSASIGPTVPNPDGSRSSMNGDFIAQGIGNVGGGLFGGLPTGGSMSRTGVAVSAGARTRWTGIFAGLWLALLVLLFGSLAGRIPMPVIGGLLIVIAGELFMGRVKDIRMVLRTSWMSSLAMIATFVATTQIPLQQAIILGAILSLILFCVQTSRASRLRGLVPDGGNWRVTDVPAALAPHAVTVVYYAGSSFFAETTRIDEQLPAPAGADRAAVVLVLRGVPEVPSSAVLKMLENYSNKLRDSGSRLYLAGVEPRLLEVMRRTGAVEVIGADAIFAPRPEMFGAARAAMDAAEAWIGQPEGEAR